MFVYQSFSSILSRIKSINHPVANHDSAVPLAASEETRVWGVGCGEEVELCFFHS